MRILAMLQTYNEERFIGPCVEHLHQQGVGVHLIDNQSTDRTLQIAESYLGRGIVAIETLPRNDCFELRAQCQHQERLAENLDADWLIHHDADEIRVSPDRRTSLAQAIAEADEAGFNAINFLEFAFVPTREQPDHEHARFRETMRWYYPFLPSFPHRLNAFKRQDGPVELAFSAGHRARFPGRAIAPQSLYMRHYLYLSPQHALEKFVRRRFAEDEVADGWFGWRAHLRAELITLPSQSQLRESSADHDLDPAQPRKTHLLEDTVSQAAGHAVE
jgi:glycosyltransferase involved in cell wall biosynthesis